MLSVPSGQVAAGRGRRVRCNLGPRSKTSGQAPRHLMLTSVWRTAGRPGLHQHAGRAWRRNHQLRRAKHLRLWQAAGRRAQAGWQVMGSRSVEGGGSCRHGVALGSWPRPPMCLGNAWCWMRRADVSSSSVRHAACWHGRPAGISHRPSPRRKSSCGRRPRQRRRPSGATCTRGMHCRCMLPYHARNGPCVTGRTSRMGTFVGLVMQSLHRIGHHYIVLHGHANACVHAYRPCITPHA